MKAKAKIITIIILTVIASGIFTLYYIKTSTVDFMGIPLGDTLKNHSDIYAKYQNTGYDKTSKDHTKTYKFKTNCDKEAMAPFDTDLFCIEKRNFITVNDYIEEISIEIEFDIIQWNEIINELRKFFGSPMDEKKIVTESSQSQNLTFSKKNRVLYQIYAELYTNIYRPDIGKLTITIRTKKYEQYKERYRKYIKKMFGI